MNRLGQFKIDRNIFEDDPSFMDKLSKKVEILDKHEGLSPTQIFFMGKCGDFDEIHGHQAMPSYKLDLSSGDIKFVRD